MESIDVCLHEDSEKAESRVTQLLSHRAVHVVIQGTGKRQFEGTRVNMGGSMSSVSGTLNLRCAVD